ncbi:lysozyme inhibitor LprI family protein [Erythrobacter sp.]|uniref:lysozyme inhibitor LprI family protein n=1 Tax=Erythrobacter sp. TaxID=1042 RepID=UPI0025F05DD2|nr:lysozyme inhibitor LprI family protein [Erythrobacter sp.]
MIASLILPLLLQSAEPPVPGWNCDDPQVQQEMNWCAARDFEVADERLNSQWKETAAAMKARDASFVEYAGDDTREGYFESLLEAQRAWLRYRDAHCRLEGYYARGGSLEPLLVSTCKARLTRMRTDELRELIEDAA